jgi:hypothetical protein
MLYTDKVRRKLNKRWPKTICSKKWEQRNTTKNSNNERAVKEVTAD